MSSYRARLVSNWELVCSKLGYWFLPDIPGVQNSWAICFFARGGYNTWRCMISWQLCLLDSMQQHTCQDTHSWSCLKRKQRQGFNMKLGVIFLRPLGFLPDVSWFDIHHHHNIVSSLTPSPFAICQCHLLLIPEQSKNWWDWWCLSKHILSLLNHQTYAHAQAL